MPIDIMLVDNDQVNSFVLKKTITRNYPSANVSMYMDGSQALEHLEELDRKAEVFPGIILLDIYMPVMDGFAFLEKYTERYAHKESIIFTMSNSLIKEDQQRANAYPVVKGFITKPLIYNNVQFVIETYLKSARPD